MTTPADPLVRPPRTRVRSAVVLGVLAVLVALWLGLAAPAVSPVAPGGGAALLAPVAGPPDRDGDGAGGREGRGDDR